MSKKAAVLFKKRSDAAKLGWVTRKKNEAVAKRKATLAKKRQK